MARSIGAFVLSAILFILVFVLVLTESQESFIILSFLGAALFFGGTGVYFTSQRDAKEKEKD